MQFRATSITLALAALIMSPLVAAQQAVCSGSIPAGSFACGGVQGGCSSCAIVTGNSGGQCVVSALCANRDGSCVVQDGRPFCV